MVLTLCLPALLLLVPPGFPRSLVDFRVERAPDPHVAPGWTIPDPPDPPLV